MGGDPPLKASPKAACGGCVHCPPRPAFVHLPGSCPRLSTLALGYGHAAPWPPQGGPSTLQALVARPASCSLASSGRVGIGVGLGALAARCSTVVLSKAVEAPLVSLPRFPAAWPAGRRRLASAATSRAGEASQNRQGAEARRASLSRRPPLSPGPGAALCTCRLPMAGCAAGVLLRCKRRRPRPRLGGRPDSISPPSPREWTMKVQASRELATRIQRLQRGRRPCLGRRDRGPSRTSERLLRKE